MDWIRYRESLTTDPLAPSPPNIAPSGDVDRATWRCPHWVECYLHNADPARRCGFEAVDRNGQELWRGCPTYRARMVDDATG